MRPAPGFSVSSEGFDPSALRARQVRVCARIRAAIGRIGDAAIVRYVGPVLEEGDALALFGLLAMLTHASNSRPRVHHAPLCVSRRGRRASAGLDEFARERPRQRRSLDLPRAVVSGHHTDGRSLTRKDG